MLSLVLLCACFDLANLIIIVLNIVYWLLCIGYWNNKIKYTYSFGRHLETIFPRDRLCYSIFRVIRYK